MVSDAHRAQGRPEWRRRFPPTAGTVYLVVAVVAAGAAAVSFIVAFLVESALVAVCLVGVGITLVGTAVMWGIRADLGPERPNRAEHGDGCTRVGIRVRDQPVVGAYLAMSGLVVAMASALIAERVGPGVGLRPVDRVGFVVVLAILVPLLGAAVLTNPFNRRLAFSPDRIVYRSGWIHADIPWASITSTAFHTAESSAFLLNRGLQDGIRFVTDSGADYAWTAFPRMQGYFPLQLTGFTVDEDTLYNVIVALHEHPELRPLVGTKEGAAMFDGPPLQVREHMTPNQVWLPWERNIHALLAGGTDT